MANASEHAELEKNFIGPAGFKAIDIGIPEPRYPSWRWFIVNLNWDGADEQSPMGRGTLTVDIEEAIPSDSKDPSRKLRILVTGPLSFRMQDEGEMVPYWHIRQTENAPISDFYEISESHYLHELKYMRIIPHGPVRHFLISGGNQCVEVIGDDGTNFKVEKVNCGSQHDT